MTPDEAHVLTVERVRASEILPDRRCDRHNSYPRARRILPPLQEPFMQPETQQRVRSIAEQLKALSNDVDKADGSREAVDFCVRLDELRLDLLRAMAEYRISAREREQ